MATCSKCGRENLDTAPVCTDCHNALLHQCPKCWHQQHRRGHCEKCGGHMAFGWRVHAATALAATVKEEMVNRGAFRRRVRRIWRTNDMAMPARAAFLAILGLRLASQWFFRLRSEK